MSAPIVIGVHSFPSSLGNAPLLGGSEDSRSFASCTLPINVTDAASSSAAPGTSFESGQSLARCSGPVNLSRSSAEAGWEQPPTAPGTSFESGQSLARCSAPVNPSRSSAEAGWEQPATVAGTRFELGQSFARCSAPVNPNLSSAEAGWEKPAGVNQESTNVPGGGESSQGRSSPYEHVLLPDDLKKDENLRVSVKATWIFFAVLVWASVAVNIYFVMPRGPPAKKVEDRPLENTEASIVIPESQHLGVPAGFTRRPETRKETVGKLATDR